MDNNLPEKPDLSQSRRIPGVRDRWLNPEQAAAYLCISERWLHHPGMQHDGPPAQFIENPGRGRGVMLYKVSDLDAYVRRFMAGVQADNPKPFMTRDEFTAGVRMVDLRTYKDVARALDCSVHDVWAYIQGTEPVPSRVARNLRLLFAAKRERMPPLWWDKDSFNPLSFQLP